MVEKNNKTCIICKNEYHYCPNCRVDNNKPSWYAIFDSQNCYNIYEICTSYRDGIINKETAKEKISKCDISGLDNFVDATKAQIKEIMGHEEKNKVEKKIDEKIETKNKNVFINKNK